MSSNRLRCLALLVAGILATSHLADAIIRRDDVPDSSYLALGAERAVVGEFSTDGLCTLIEPRWAITAAHVAQDWSPFVPTVRFGERDYAIESIVMHPTWSGRARRDSVDMALVKLATPVEGIAPAAIYEDQDELGMETLFIGNGMAGTGSTGPLEAPDEGPAAWRGATNRIDDLRPDWLVFTFDAPPAALPMEGISGPGDSGGPALLNRDGRRFILGVSSSNDGEPPCTYGTREYYARVSAHASWIRATMASVAPPLASTSPRPTSELDVRGGLGFIALKYFEAYNSHDAATIAAFEQTYRAVKALEQKSAADRGVYWVGKSAEWGRLVPELFAWQGDRLCLGMRRASDGAWMTFIVLPSAEPGKFEGFLVSPLRRPPSIVP